MGKTSANGVTEARPPVARMAAEAVPDFMGTAARVEAHANLIQSAQDQLLRLHGQRLINGHELDDEIPMEASPGQPEPAPITYREREDDLHAGIARLMADSADIREELIAEAVRRRKTVEQRIAESHAT